MAETTIRVKIGSKLCHKLIQSLEQKQQWSHEFELWDVKDIKRMERTDYVRVLLSNDRKEAL